jgi:RimJ/RimL family protein N-acetyltransferase
VKFTLREADEDDVPFIARLFTLPHSREFLNEPGRDAILDLIEGAEGEAFVLEADGEDFGYFTMHDRGWLMELGVLVVQETGLGAGPFAMRWGIEQAFQKRNAHRIFIEIREDNDRARAMCERLGFKAEGLYRDGFHDAVSGEYKNLIPYGMLRTDFRSVT